VAVITGGKFGVFSVIFAVQSTEKITENTPNFPLASNWTYCIYYVVIVGLMLRLE
jgi:hypothetical protein